MKKNDNDTQIQTSASKADHLSIIMIIFVFIVPALLANPSCSGLLPTIVSLPLFSLITSLISLVVVADPLCHHAKQRHE